MKKLKWLGIPMPIIAVVLAVMLLSGGTMLAMWMMEQSNTGSVTIRGSGAVILLSDGTTVLNDGEDLPSFGELRNSPGVSDTVQLQIKTVPGGDTVYPTVAVDSLPSYLILNEAVYGEIGATPVNLYQEAYWTLPYTPHPEGSVNAIPNAVTVEQTTIIFSHNTRPTNIPSLPNPTPESPWFIRWDNEGNEICMCTAWDSGTKTMTVVRGYAGTTASAHPALATCTFVELVSVPKDGLDDGEILILNFTLSPAVDLTPYIGTVADLWNLNFSITSDY